MRTTLALDDELVAQAQELTGIKEKKSTILMNMQRLPRASIAGDSLFGTLLLRHRFRYGASSAKSAAPRRSLAACA